MWRGKSRIECEGGKRPGQLRLTLNLLILVFSAYIAARIYADSHLAACVPSALGLASLLALLLRTGWIIPCTILGVYTGMFALAPGIGGGTALSQMTDTALRISACTALGLILGLALDAKRCDR